MAYLKQEFAKTERQRSRDARGPAPRPEHAPRGRLRGGQQLEPRAQRALRPGPGLPGADLRQPGSGLAGRRADRHPRPAGQDRGDRARPARSRLLEQFRPLAGDPRRRRDDGAGHPGLCRVRPQAPELDGAVAWLLAHRAGTGWQPHKAKGPALAALASYYGRAQGAEDRYRLTVTVNETQVAELNVTGSTEGQAIAVPRKALKIGQPNRVRFDMEGRGRFGYAVTLAGFTREFKPDQDRTQPRRDRSIAASIYPAAPELDGKVLPVGFGVAVNATHFENLASQVALGRQGPRRHHRLAQHPREHARMGARFLDRRRAPAGRRDLDRRLGADDRHVVRPGRRRA